MDARLVESGPGESQGDADVEQSIGLLAGDTQVPIHGSEGQVPARAGAGSVSADEARACQPKKQRKKRSACLIAGVSLGVVAVAGIIAILVTVGKCKKGDDHGEYGGGLLGGGGDQRSTGTKDVGTSNNPVTSENGPDKAPVDADTDDTTDVPEKAPVDADTDETATDEGGESSPDTTSDESVFVGENVFTENIFVGETHGTKIANFIRDALRTLHGRKKVRLWEELDPAATKGPLKPSFDGDAAALTERQKLELAAHLRNTESQKLRLLDEIGDVRGEINLLRLNRVDQCLDESLDSGTKLGFWQEWCHNDKLLLRSPDLSEKRAPSTRIKRRGLPPALPYNTEDKMIYDGILYSLELLVDGLAGFESDWCRYPSERYPRVELHDPCKVPKQDLTGVIHAAKNEIALLKSGGEGNGFSLTESIPNVVLLFQMGAAKLVNEMLLKKNYFSKEERAVLVKYLDGVQSAKFKGMKEDSTYDWKWAENLRNTQWVHKICKRDRKYETRARVPRLVIMGGLHLADFTKKMKDAGVANVRTLAVPSHEDYDDSETKAKLKSLPPAEIDALKKAFAQASRTLDHVIYPIAEFPIAEYNSEAAAMWEEVKDPRDIGATTELLKQIEGLLAQALPDWFVGTISEPIA